MCGDPTVPTDLEGKIAIEKKCLTDGRIQAVTLADNPEHALLEVKYALMNVFS